MAFPLPLDPEFRREIIDHWLIDVEDRLEAGYLEDAEISWKIANALYLNLPPGEGTLELEASLFAKRVKLNQVTPTITNEDHL